MPKVGSKKFSYTARGRTAAAKARQAQKTKQPKQAMKRKKKY
jgi:hypothetical protein